MFALIYLGLAIALGDFVGRRFYRFLLPHRYATALLVGILLSTLFTYLAALAFAHTAEPLLWADLLFLIAAAAVIFWLPRKFPKIQMIGSRAPGRAVYDWITLGALFIAGCVLLMGTLYVNKQGRIRVSALEATDFLYSQRSLRVLLSGTTSRPNVRTMPANRFIMIFFSIFKPAIWNSLG